MTESVLTKKIARALRDSGAWAVKTHGDPRQRRGLPDLMGCYRGVMFGLEVKLPGKERTLTEIQKQTLMEIKRAGGLAFMITTVDQALKVLRHIDART